MIVTINGLILLVQTALMDRPSTDEADANYGPWVSYIFVGCEYNTTKCVT